MTMRIGQHRYTIDYGHLALVTLIAAATFWYLLDTRSVSLSINNLLLVQPVAIFALAMYLFIVPQCFHRVDAKEVAKPIKEQDPLAPTLPSERSDVIKMAVLGGSLGLLVFTVDYIGFDIGIFLFTATAMAVCGERRPLHLIAFSLAVTLAGIYGFRALIPFPMFTAIL
jgi:hypothetical protein